MTQYIDPASLGVAWYRAQNQATPLFLCCRQNHLETAQLLVSVGADVNAMRKVHTLLSV